MLRKALIAVAGLLFAISASADGRAAARNLFANLDRAQASLSISGATAVVSPTLVKGIYSLSNQQGSFVGFTNEAGTLFGDSRGFTAVGRNGEQPRPLKPNEVHDLRAEVMEAIDYDKLPRIVYGDGGGRRLVLFSAVDCSFCKMFEDTMGKQSTGLNSTFYVIPASLQKIAHGGEKRWQVVSRIWCAKDAGAAWQSFWTTRAVPSESRQCRFNEPGAAEVAVQQLRDILQAVSVRVTSTPQVIREDGTVIANKPAMSPEYVVSTFGPIGTHHIHAKPALSWLAIVSEGGRN